MVRPCFSYFACQSRNCGITFLQLYQPKVQNSTMTTRPRSFSRLRGSLLIQGPPVISGARSPSRSPIAPAAPGSSAPARSPTASTHAPAALMDPPCGGATPPPCPSYRRTPSQLDVSGQGRGSRGPGEEVGYPPPTPYNNDGERVGMGPPRFTDAIERYPLRKGNG